MLEPSPEEGAPFNHQISFICGHRLPYNCVEGTIGESRQLYACFKEILLVPIHGANTSASRWTNNAFNYDGQGGLEIEPPSSKCWLIDRVEDTNTVSGFRSEEVRFTFAKLHVNQTLRTPWSLQQTFCSYFPVLQICCSFSHPQTNHDEAHLPRSSMWRCLVVPADFDFSQTCDHASRVLRLELCRRYLRQPARPAQGRAGVQAIRQQIF